MGNKRNSGYRKSKRPHHVALRKRPPAAIDSAINCDTLEDNEIGTDSGPVPSPLGQRTLHTQVSTPLKTPVQKRLIPATNDVTEGVSPPVKFQRVCEAKTYSQKRPIQQEHNNASCPVSTTIVILILFGYFY